MKGRLALINKNKETHFSNHIHLDRSEIAAERKLFKIRDEMLLKDPSLVTGFYYDKLDALLNSPLYEALN